MVKDAEAHAEEDEQPQGRDRGPQQTATRWSTPPSRRSPSWATRSPADVKSQADAAIDEAKTALEGTDIEAIKAATEKLQQAGYKLAEVVYSCSRTRPRAGAGARARHLLANDDTIEADYEVVDDDKEGQVIMPAEPNRLPPSAVRPMRPKGTR